MAHPVRTHATLNDWIAHEAIPFSIDSAESLNAAIGKLIAALGGDSLEILGFGEALHGGEELLILRNRLFQQLVEAHGYSAIAVESSFPKGRAVNDYIAGRGSQTYDDIQETGFSHNFGKLEANRELVEWMRSYNANTSHPLKLRFYGFDSPTEMTGTDSPRQLLHFALDYLSSLDSVGGQAHRERIDMLLGEDAAWENPAAMMDPAQSIGLSPAATSLRIETENLITELALRRPELTAKGGATGAEQYQQATHDLTAARGLLNYHALLAGTSPNRIAEGLGLRDAMMTDNLAYIVRRERTRAQAHAHGGARVFAFAHNSHLKRGQAEWQLGPHALAWWPAGAHLAEMFGPRYAVIGTGVGVSEANSIAQPEPGTLEARLLARLTAAPFAPSAPALFIPTHLSQNIPAAEIASLPTRTGSTKNFSYFPFTPQSLTDFDALAFLPSTTYNRGGPPLP